LFTVGVDVGLDVVGVVDVGVDVGLEVVGVVDVGVDVGFVVGVGVVVGVDVVGEYDLGEVDADDGADNDSFFETAFNEGFFINLISSLVTVSYCRFGITLAPGRFLRSGLETTFLSPSDGFG